MHAKRVVPYLVRQRRNRDLEKLRQQAFHYDATYHLTDKVTGVRKGKHGYELQIHWMGSMDNADVTWKPLKNICDDVPGILKDFLHTPGEAKLKREIFDLYF